MLLSMLPMAKWFMPFRYLFCALGFVISAASFFFFFARADVHTQTENLLSDHELRKFIA